MNDVTREELLTFAKRLAQQAATVSLVGPDQASAKRKADDSLVTETDHRIQALILNAIAQAYPAHAVAAEETVSAPHRHAGRSNARYWWVVDPLDGTRNYVAQIPCFSTSIAVMDQGRPIVGVVVEHNSGWIWTATQGGGVRLNGRPVRASETPPETDRIVGFTSSKSGPAVGIMRDWLARRGLINRNMGSTALHLAMVASGAFDAALLFKCKLWDMAAGYLMVREAGARITDLTGRDPMPFPADADPGADIPSLAARQDMHASLLASIAETLPHRAN
jgi:myo-inositol-1(or 4)-monophosphatase